MKSVAGTSFRDNRARVTRIGIRGLATGRTIAHSIPIEELYRPEAFWRLYQRPPTSKANLEGWLYRTGVRLALDRLKMDRRRARYESLAALFGIVRSPDLTLAEREEQVRVRTTLAVLKPDQTTLIVLRSDGLTYAELAAALDIKLTSVGTALSRAEAAFRREYVRRYGEFSTE